MATALQNLQIGLVNNMPPSAREATTRQFRELLGADTGLGPRLRLFTLAGMADDSAYRPSDEIFEAGIDALIFTGTEPTTPDLRDEPYWPRMSALLDWIEENSVPAIFSCLAAHAAALHWDGIARRPLREKCFGVFEETICADHPLMKGITGPLHIPHSRWNDLSSEDLLGAGYQILSSSPAAGVDIFVRGGRSLSVFFQGHPEYDADRLLLEYRRDARRFMSGVRPDYPNLPLGYFDSCTEDLLKRFREGIMQAHRVPTYVDFPVSIAAPATAPWRPEAEGVFSNWLDYVRERQA